MTETKSEIRFTIFNISQFVNNSSSKYMTKVKHIF